VNPNSIPNANDPNFKSLLDKLISAEWIDRVTDTPATATTKRNFNFSWTLKGQFCALALVKQMSETDIWREASAFAASLNEQEEAFFHEVFLSEVPR
jgi:hypothetical protein